MNDGTTQEVPHILKDGSDSIGPAGAALRVYVNIGTCPDYRMSLEDTLWEFSDLAVKFRCEESNRAASVRSE